MQQIILTLSQAMDAARRKFTRAEQSMLIDIYNATALSPPFLGDGMIAQVEDSFSLHPGQYEDKWGVDQAEMLDKIRALNPLDAALIELWAVGYWPLNNTVPDSLRAYLGGTLNLYTHMESALKMLDDAVDKLESTKSAFKSAAVAEARAMIEQAAQKLRGD